MRIRFVTGNRGKVREAKAALGPLGIEVEAVPQPVVEIQSDSLEAVARAKADALMARVRPPYFVEDAGLFVDALGGFPGVYSAYAYKTLGCEGLLQLMRNRKRRTATFRAVVALVEPPGRSHLFVGEVRGSLASGLRGTRGFGFDPVFQPRGSRRTFAEMSTEEKSKQSHRGRALARLARYLTRAAV